MLFADWEQEGCAKYQEKSIEQVPKVKQLYDCHHVEHCFAGLLHSSHIATGGVVESVVALLSMKSAFSELNTLVQRLTRR